MLACSRNVKHFTFKTVLKHAKGATRTYRSQSTRDADKKYILCTFCRVLPKQHFASPFIRYFSKAKVEKSNSEQGFEETYQKKTPIEHVLLRPDTYIGGVEKITGASCWILKRAKNTRIVMKDDSVYVPGLYKIFDEILVNASDNKQRDSSMDEIRVDIDASTNTITVFNNGKGIPIHMHKKEKLYIPELVLGQLFTGSNFDDSKSKVTGGRNGYGAKLTNIFSTEFKVETVDSSKKQKYTQIWKNNMTQRSDPVIEPCQEMDYTRVTFKPDLAKFGMESLNQTDILGLMERRVYDISGCNNTIKVYLNGQLLPSGFNNYLALYETNQQPIGEEDNEEDEEGEIQKDVKKATPANSIIIERINSRWEIGFNISTSGQFTQVSFVNGICTSRGGTHVNYITEQICRFILEQVKKKEKEMDVSLNHIKNHLSVFVNCLIENPAFDSQTKETLTTQFSQFGSKCNLSERFMQEVVQKTKIIDHVLRWAKMKKQSELARTVKNNSKIVMTIPKLYDANLAGTERSQECTLILTEGDSAKALAVAGLSVIGRDKYGVFPLRGKLLNVSEATHRQLLDNAEVNHLVTILGLQYNKDYSSAQSRAELRYGKVMLMTDQDHDGSHIKGLFINFLHHFWPSLLKSDGFLEEFITPIVKATKGKDKQVFFTIPEYENWKKTVGNSVNQWHIKYYKGLGTNTPTEAKEYFSNLDKHRILFKWDNKSSSLIGTFIFYSFFNCAEMAFIGENTDKRKEWLNQYQDNTFVDHSNKSVSYSDFINKELILFSRADNIRSIPSMVDGLKPGQRKVLFAAFKRKLTSEIKVAQLAGMCMKCTITHKEGYVSEQTAYHHGEASLHGTIVHMAQNFVGSNNIPLFVPSGQFGTRLQGGKDAASARYLFTRLDPIARKIFPEVDDDLLNYLDDDGQPIQPEYYVPIMPLVLVNGTKGVGTGWSTNIPMFNPVDVIDNILKKMNNHDLTEMVPWAKGFQGTIEKKKPNSFVSSGIIEKAGSSTIVIKELPLNVWVDDYKQFLDGLVKPTQGAAKSFIRSYTMQHTTESVKFVIKLAKVKTEEAEEVGLVKKFKLESSLSTSNMHLFDANGRLKSYNSPLEVISDFYDVRKDFYGKRKAHLTEKLEKEVVQLTNQVKFINAVATGALKLGNRTKRDIVQDLAKLGLQYTSEDPDQFNYLLNTPLWNITKEKIEKLQQEQQQKDKDLHNLRQTSPLNIWQQELIDLRKDLVANTQS